MSLFSNSNSKRREPTENLEVVSDSETANVQKINLPENQPIAYDPIEAAKNEFDKFYFTHRKDLDKYFDKAAARYVSQHLPRIAAYSERNEGRAANAIRALMRNEQMYYGADDALFDGIIRQTGVAIKNVHNFTAGPGQISISNIQALAVKYPELFDHKSGSELCQLSTDPYIATLLVGTYIDDRIGLFEQWAKKNPAESTLSKDEKLLFKNAFPLWVSGLQTQSIIMSFNPGGGRRDHLSNVLKHLRLLEKAD